MKGGINMVNPETGTRVDEIADKIYRISTAVPPSVIPGGLTFNQFLIVDEQPLLFHSGLRRLFEPIRKAVSQVLPFERLRFIGVSHFEADECGSINEMLAAAPNALPLCGKISAMVSLNDVADRKAKVLVDGQTLSLGTKSIRWFDTPHLPHAWDCGFVLEEKTRTLLCGDLFTQGGNDVPPLTESDVLGKSEEFRKKMDYFSHTRNTLEMITRLADANPATLACMHGSAWRGDGSALLKALGELLSK
jgi:flavorubredoxin